MKITVIGGGNIGTLMAAEFSHKGHSVTIYTSKPHKFSHGITVFDNENNKIFSTDLSSVTDDLNQAVTEADIVFVTLPAFMFSQLAKDLELRMHKGQWLGIVPGTGNAQAAFQQLINRGIVLFGFQRVHSIARCLTYGNSVAMLGRKSQLELAAIPAQFSEKIAQCMTSLFDMPCEVLPNYYCIILTPSNPILHTARIYDLFAEYQQGKYYPKNYLFYEEWTDRASEVLFACDEELQQLCEKIPEDMTSVLSLKTYYESETPQKMTHKIQSIKAFKKILSPMKETENGWIPDFESRYFTADFPYGIKVLIDYAKKFHVETPTMQMVWDWYKSITNYKE